jgi:hypothetical protein
MPMIDSGKTLIPADFYTEKVLGFLPGEIDL